MCVCVGGGAILHRYSLSSKINTNLRYCTKKENTTWNTLSKIL